MAKNICHLVVLILIIRKICFQLEANEVLKFNNIQEMELINLTSEALISQN